MGDYHVDRQVEHVEHGAGGCLGVFADGEALAIAMANHAVGKFKMIFPEGHAGVGNIEGQETVGTGRKERQFLTGIERPEEPNQFTRLRRQHARFEIGQPRGKDIHGLVQPSKAFLCFFFEALRCAAIEERKKTLGRRTVHDCECQCFVAQPAGRQLLAPLAIHFACKTPGAHGFKLRRDRF